MTASDLASKNEIRHRATTFAARWAGGHREHSEKQTFWNEFFEVFGVSRTRVAVFEFLAQRASTGNAGFIDLLYPGEMAVEHKTTGSPLESAMTQLHDYLPALHSSEHPWLLVVCDFEHFRWRNLAAGTEGAFDLADLPDHLDLFWWLAAFPKPGEQFESEEDANLKATALLEVVYDELSETGYDPHAVRQWVTRILFCLFADDTGVWDRALFHTYLARNTRTDGSDLGRTIAELFQVLDTPPTRRPGALDEDLASFSYINGDLFADVLPIPTCTEPLRTALLRACGFNWSIISPAIFGSLFQNVMAPRERRHLGAHYTTEANILRTIRPLFLDGLEAELAAAESRPRLEAFHDRLANLRVMDPACGCGNFLVIAYREMRRLETECLRRLSSKERREGQRTMSLELLCRVRVDQFFGIEIEEFPARIARTALYLADHIANREVSAEFGEHYARFPIPASPHIKIGNALRLDWNSVLPAEDCSYVVGNPPFSGHALAGQDQRMVEDKAIAFEGLPHQDTRVGRLDYVAAWYAKAIPYVQAGAGACAFVSTNSITQGEQARSLGPIVAACGMSIAFGHRTFAWTSEAQGRAQVHVVIIGFAQSQEVPNRKRLFDYPDVRGEPVEHNPRELSWYLIPSPPIYPAKRRTPLVGGIPTPPTKGSQPTDGGHLLVSSGQYAEVAADPVAAQYLRRFEQTSNFLNGEERWCLWLEAAPPGDLRSSPVLRQRLAEVARCRAASRTASVRMAAATPALFTQRRQPTGRYLAIPEVSSERRRYIPMDYREADVIAGNKLLTVEGAPVWLFGVLSSAMWMAWVRTIVGRLESRYSVAPDLAYSAFPFPELTEPVKGRIGEAASAVLRCRAEAGPATLEELYDPLAMPPDLVEAHRALDQSVDRSYGRHRHSGDESRLPVLLARYVELTGGDAALFDADSL